MLIRDFPNELVIVLGTHLPACDLYNLILVNHRFSILLLPRLRTLSLEAEHAKAALYWAVLSGDRSLAIHVLEKGESIAVIRTVDNHVVHRAPGECDDKTLDWVMAQRARLSLEVTRRRYLGIGPRPCPSNSQRAVEWAIQNEHYALLRLSLSAHGNVMNARFYSEVVFFAACCESGSAIENLRGWVGSSFGGRSFAELLNMALSKAVEEDLWVPARFLLEKGADANARNFNRQPVLLIAVTHAATMVVRVLLEGGADIDVWDADGNSPFALARGRILEILQENKCQRAGEGKGA